MTDRKGGALHFFFEAQRYDVECLSLTGAEIKAVANCPPEATLFLEAEGNKPDKRVLDSENIYIEGRVKRFYALR